MSNYLSPDLSGALHEISALGLAHVGDAVFELMVRTWLCKGGALTAKRIHGGAVEFVSAKSQAAAAGVLLPQLNDEEAAVFRRGRNARVNTVPNTCTYEEYHLATGMEALFGYLYLSGRRGRLDELFEIVLENQTP